MPYPKGKPQSVESNAKRSAALTGRSDGALARWSNPNYRVRMSRPRSAETQAQMSASAKRRDPATRFPLPRGSQKGRKFSEQHRHHLSEAAKKRDCYRQSQHEEFLDHKGRIFGMRSSWEVEYARYLDREGLDWFYEPCAILLSDGRRYIPDFWVVEWNSYVEIKGWRSPEKAELAQRDGYAVRIIFGIVAFQEAIK